MFVTERSARGILDGLRAGRTAISFLPPVTGALPLQLEADVDRDGVFESIAGSTVPPGTPMRVHAPGTLATGLVQVRANGQTVIDNEALLPGGEIAFDAPARGGWVRASLFEPDATAERSGTCDSLVGTATTYCRDHITVAGISSPIYIAT